MYSFSLDTSTHGAAALAALRAHDNPDKIPISIVPPHKGFPALLTINNTQAVPIETEANEGDAWSELAFKGELEQALQLGGVVLFEFQDRQKTAQLQRDNPQGDYTPTGFVATGSDGARTYVGIGVSYLPRMETERKPNRRSIGALLSESARYFGAPRLRIVDERLYIKTADRIHDVAFNDVVDELWRLYDDPDDFWR